MVATLDAISRNRQVRYCKLRVYIEIRQQWEMEPSADEIRQWLRDVLAQNRETPSGLARKAGVSPSTLTRFLSAEDDKGVLSFRTAAKIAHAAGVPPPMVRQIQVPQGFFDVEATPFDFDRTEQPQTHSEHAIHALVAGRPAAQPWLLASNVVEDAGYLPGDILIVDLNAKAERGDVVCAQVYQWSKGTAETVFRVYEPPYLLAATRSIAKRKPFLVDNDQVIIKGVVTDALRTTRSLRTMSPSPDGSLPG